jgi:hypothetical protein
VIEDNTHPQLTPSNSLQMSSAHSHHHLGQHLLNRTSSDESGLSARFFMLKKDSERRNTLASFIQEYKQEVGENLRQICQLFMSVSRKLCKTPISVNRLISLLTSSSF